MEVTRRIVDDVVVLTVTGKIVGQGSVALKDALDALLDAAPENDPPRLALNLEDAPLLDSAGLGAILAVQQRLLKQGGKVVLCRVAPHIQRLLTVAKLTQILPTYSDEDAAIHALMTD